MRSALRQFHLWLALVTGGLFCLIGLSGSYLLFYQEADQYLLGFTPPRAEASISADQALAIADRTTGLTNAPMRQVEHGEIDGPYTVFHVTGDTMALGFRQTIIDQTSGRVLAVRDLIAGHQSIAQNMTGLMLGLHSGMLFGLVGISVWGVLSLAFIALVAVGVYLWWPGWRRLGRAFKLRTRPGAPGFWIDLHKVLGSYASLILLMLLFTAFTISAAMTVPKFLAGAPAASAPATEAVVPARVAMSIGQSVDAALRTMPQSWVSGLMVSADVTQPLRVTLQTAGGHEMVLAVNRMTGNVATADTGGSAGKVMSTMIMLHGGEGLGPIYGALLFIAGLLPTVFMVSGIIIWQARTRRMKISVAARQQPTA